MVNHCTFWTSFQGHWTINLKSVPPMNELNSVEVLKLSYIIENELAKLVWISDISCYSNYTKILSNQFHWHDVSDMASFSIFLSEILWPNVHITKLSFLKHSLMFQQQIVIFFWCVVVVGAGCCFHSTENLFKLWREIIQTVNSMKNRIHVTSSNSVWRFNACGEAMISFLAKGQVSNHSLL